MSPFLLTMTEKEVLEKLVTEKAAGSDIFLVEVKVTPGKITVLIDKPNGINLGECLELNRELAKELEPAGMLDSHELEVSSPGMDQPLKVFQQYQRRVGREVKVTTRDGRQYEGKLVSALPEGIDLVKTTILKQNKKKEIREETIHLPFEIIKETKLILTFKN